MTDEEIIDAARDSGIFMPRRRYMVTEGDTIHFGEDKSLTMFDMSLIKFVREVQAAERERCAKLCEEVIEYPAGHRGAYEGYGPVKTPRDGLDCAAAIRKGEA